MTENQATLLKKCYSLTYTKDQLPGKAARGGHIYLIEYQDGSVKVGYTANPRNRVASHWSDARKFGHQVARVWVSKAHANHITNEKEAIMICNEFGDQKSGKEYFSGEDLFDTVLPHLENLEFMEGGSENQDGISAFVKAYVEETHKRMDVEDKLTAAKQIAGSLFEKGADPFTTVVFGGEDSATRINRFMKSFEGPAGTLQEQSELFEAHIKLADLFDMNVLDFVEYTALDLVKLMIENLVEHQLLMLELDGRAVGKDLESVRLIDMMPDVLARAEVPTMD